ncbi:hypothetical protein SacmaDRAFT_0256 [Saccharomonospora marina XMU15]|uniref:SseB protein N-terminal domain-containing protein n=1 Tax=Saccharomonospora marina XMU15 TaxID=882083 RepID=H5X0A6_9PSEU|nr:SseB family protein [Saccharomonospora marina]EHR48566.1 hypothetical protein SacmaDRAFT_0256 [Saccharomonospora marina XMU15]
MVAAARDGQGQRYAELVLSGPLYLPKLPDRDSDEWWDLVRELTLPTENVLVFTSVEAMSAVLGSFVQGYQETDYASLVRRWPNPGWLLALNPGLPIGLIAPPAALYGLANGEVELTPVAQVQADYEAGAEEAVRHICLRGLGAQDKPAYAKPPVNELEEALAEAVSQQDGDGFLNALLAAEVVVAVSEPVTDPTGLTESDFPFHKTGEDFPVIPVFSSTEVLDHLAPSLPHRMRLPFLAVLANWPDETHVLCFNPGTETEVVLFGDTVLELVAEVADSLSGGGEGIGPAGGRL